MHDITNSSKHRFLSSNKSELKLFGVPSNAFNKVFTGQFGIDSLMVEMENGERVKFCEIAESVLDFWLYYFKIVLKIPNESLRIRMDEYFI